MSAEQKPEIQFNQSELSQVFQELQSTVQQITYASDLVINLCKNGYHKETIETWYKSARDFINSGEETKFIYLMNLSHYINQKIKDDQIMSNHFKENIEKLMKILVDTPLNKAKNDCIKIFDIQIQRGIFPQDYLENLKQILKQDVGEIDKLPENPPHPPSELVQFITNRKLYEQTKEKYNNKEYKSEQEKNKLIEIQNKYLQYSLKNYKDIMIMIDKLHLKSVVESKKMEQKIQKIQELIQQSQ
ncbi:hypothetical protein PPERSA_04757 [Pseudocohnilembus persalinus]|uniref:CID domain-containing protein n=1 Tax=Pseudocohnilembus persalinus TaxID=266149 RepID=A0A0V0QNW0_PSEPJ|nr:hypothetical protein PPERSA_04757 [Pseudocohnilembus persalinus]|eukprot:KRX03879.1 hypothetical protein PPERSA_04757 [Pseudocohnilembus persalinus]